MTALNQAYASNSETPVHTFEFLHSSVTGGAIRLVQGYYDIQATLEGSPPQTVTFSKSGITVSLPQKSSDGRQDLDIELDNVSNAVWQELQSAITAIRTTNERIICKYRPFLESDLSAPAGPTYVFTVMQAVTTRKTAGIRASFAVLPDTAYPRKRYYPTIYPGLKYV